jgi:hypothetical protein
MKKKGKFTISLFENPDTGDPEHLTFSVKISQ